MTPPPRKPQASCFKPSHLVWLAALVLFVFHQDFWFWSDTTLWFGFMPVGLAYHSLFSIAAGLLWAAAVKFAWPTHLEHWADAADEEAEA